MDRARRIIQWMDEQTVERWGDALLGAYGGTPVGPVTAEYPDVSLEDAYRIQLHQVAAWKDGGRSIAGYKVGLTSKAMQRQLRVDRPDFGHLFTDMVQDEAAPIPVGRYLAPRVEPEISFVLARDLMGPGLTMLDVLAAVDYAIASIEIIDSRIVDWRIRLADTIADNASSGGLVVGTRPVRIDATDLALAGCVVTRNGLVAATGAGAAVLGHPLHGVLFLANTLGALGRRLEAGSVIMAGALCAALPVAPGDRFTARFASLGTVHARFAAQNETETT